MNTKNKFIFLGIISMILFQSCKTNSIALKNAFIKAGKNKSELKAVIKHYSKHQADSLKKKAAIFLIENMDGHFSYKSKEWTKYNNELDSIYKLELPKYEMIQAYNALA